MALWARKSVPGAFRGLVETAGFGERDSAVVRELATRALDHPVTDLSAAAGGLVLSAELPCS